jgi:uncharacterized protein
MKRLLLCLLLLLIPAQLLALEPPRLIGRVNDYASLLSPGTASALEKKMADFEQEQSTQVVLLTIPSLQGDDIDQFTIRVADSWKIGQKGKDNGVLLVIARAERKVRIEVGMGLQGVLPDITASRIIRDTMRPHLKRGDFDAGISAGVEAIMAATKGEFTPSPRDTGTHKIRGSGSPITFFLLAAVAAAILGSFSRLLGGLAGAVGLPLAASVVFPGTGLLLLLILALVGFGGGLLLGSLFSGGFGSGGGGFYGGGGWGGGSSGDNGGFSGGGGGFDGGGSSDDY